MFGILPGPGSAFDLKEAAKGGRDHFIDIDEKFLSLIVYKKTSSILFNFHLFHRLKVFPIEAQTLCCWCKVPGTGEENIMREAEFHCFADEGETGADVGHVTAIINKMILAVPQEALFFILKNKIGVIFVVVTPAKDFNP